MRRLSKAMTAAALAATTATSLAVPADAATRHHRHHYYGRTAYHYRYCRRSNGGTGLIVGGVAGAVAGPSIIGHGVLGAIAGGVGGAVAGRAIDRTMTARHRCYYR
jgi:alanine dehydrogenase